MSRFFLEKVYLLGSLGWRGWWDFQPGASYVDDREGKAWGEIGTRLQSASCASLCILGYRFTFQSLDEFLYQNRASQQGSCLLETNPVTGGQERYPQVIGVF